MRFVRLTQTLSDAADAATRIVAVPVMAFYILLTFSGVVARFVLRAPIMEAVIYSRMGFVWTCLLGAALAYKRMRHIRFTAASALLPARWRGAWGLGIDFLSLGFILWVLVYGVAITRRVWPSNISGTSLSNGFIYMALPAALAVMAFHCVNRIARGVADLRAAEENK